MIIDLDDFKKEINDLLLKMQSGENCISETESNLSILLDSKCHKSLRPSFIGELLIKMQMGENCIGETTNKLLHAFIDINGKGPCIEDLSYSNIVNSIQGEDIKGADMLDAIAHEMENNKKLIAEIEHNLMVWKHRQISLLEGSKRILKHLGKDYPLTVKRQSYVVYVSPEDIVIDRNVI